jgi:hypothetical protein
MWGVIQVRYDNLHGDEDEIEAEYRENKRLYEEEHADDYKYTEEWLSVDTA